MHAARFRALHVPGTPLVLANVWDVLSAVIVADAGAPALATSSAAAAWSAGYADGEALPFPRVVDLVERIRARIDLPLSVDLESGGADPRETADRVSVLAAAGACGVNLEDWHDGRLLEPGEMCERIAAVKARCGDAVFINGRTDVWLRSLGADDTRTAHGIARLRAYAAAGADGVFAPGTTDGSTIRAIVAGTGAPVNALAPPDPALIRQLAACGAARVSVGSGLCREMAGAVAGTAQALYGSGSSAAAPSYDVLQRRFA